MYWFSRPLRRRARCGAHRKQKGPSIECHDGSLIVRNSTSHSSPSETHACESDGERVHRFRFHQPRPSRFLLEARIEQREASIVFGDEAERRADLRRPARAPGLQRE